MLVLIEQSIVGCLCLSNVLFSELSVVKSLYLTNVLFIEVSIIQSCLAILKLVSIELLQVECLDRSINFCKNW